MRTMRPISRSIIVAAVLICLSCGPKSGAGKSVKDPSPTSPEYVQSTSSAAQDGGYYSETCHYRIEYPQGILVTLHNRDRRSGEGEEFGSKDQRFKGRVGCHEDSKATVASQVQLRLNAEPALFKLAFKTIKPDWYAYSGVRDNNIYYERAIVTGRNVITLSMEYPVSAKAEFDLLVRKLSNSLEEYEYFTGTVSSVPSLDSDQIVFGDTPEAANILSTVCRYDKSEAARFAAVMLDDEIRVGGKMHFVTYRKDPDALGGIYRKELWNCVLKEVVRHAGPE